MKRTSLLVALVVVGTVLVPVAGVAAQETDDETDDQDVSPGERLSGVVGVQSAEFDGEIERNAFRIGLERADDNATKARHIAEQLNETEDRLAELNERKAELQEQRENETISEGQYRARMAKLSAETETQRQQLNQSNETAAELPAEALEANGVNTTAIRTLMNDANELRGDEVAEIARSIAGDRSGIVDRGPRGAAGDASDDRAGDRDGGNQSDDRSGDRDGADQQDTPDGQDGTDTESADTDGSGSSDAEAGSERDAGSDGERAGPR